MCILHCKINVCVKLKLIGWLVGWLVTGTNFIVRSYEKIPLDPCNFTNKSNSHTPKVEIHGIQKLCHFGHFVVKAKQFCRNFDQKRFLPVTRAVVHLGKFPSRLPRSRSQKQGSPTSHMNTSKLLRRKEWRGDIPDTKSARLPGLV